MTLADLFDWFALDSKHVAEQTDDPKQRERWMSWQSCGQPPHDRAMTKRSAATLPPGGPTNFAQAKGRQDNGVPAGFEYLPPIPVRRKGWSFHGLVPSIGLDVARHQFLGQCSVHETQLKPFLPSTKSNFSFDFERVFLSI